MPRIHLFEFHDQPACPRILRRAITDCVAAAWTFTGLWRNVVPHLSELLARDGGRRIVDLCSGSAGPLMPVVRQLRRELPGLQVTLTDLYPQIELEAALSAESGGAIHYHPQPVDATAVPAELVGVRTIFGAFHHFTPDEALRLLRDASRAGRPIGIFEYQRREFLRNHVWPTGLVGLSPLVVLGAGQREAWRIALTAVPIIPLLWAWDSVVSILRTYTPEELLDLARRAAAPGYRWEVREARSSGRGRITCLLGFPDPRGGAELVVY